jgi:microcompartment protein CcmK/EutM
MRHVTVYTTDKEYNHFIELTKNLHYVKKIETDEEPTKEEILDNIKAGLEEMKLIKKGKLKTTPLNDFLNEL